jgi:predicted dehydrogenase
MSAVAGNNNRIRVAVVGAGEFGRNHARVYRELATAELTGIYDKNPERAKQIAAEFQTKTFASLEDLRGQVDAASVAVPTIDHASVGCRLMELGLDVLVEKPMASNLEEADALLAAAKKFSRILQVGHVERFNPAVIAVEPILNRPLFFEVHRLGVFTPRSLDVDVIYDLMIHDLDILLTLVKEPVTEVKAVGIPVLTDKVDIAHARLEFAGGAVANITAS